MRLLLLLSLLLTSCGVDHRASGDVDHNVTSTSTVELVITIDLSGCMEIAPEHRLECILSVTEATKELISVAKILACTRDLEAVSVGEGTNPPESCRDVIGTKGE